MWRLAVALLTVLAPISQEQHTTRLEWRFTKGDSLKYNIAITNIEFGNQSEWAFRWAWQVVDVNSEGTATIKMTFERVKTPDFDSDKTPRPAETDMVGRCYAAILGKPITLTLSKEGKCLRASGTKELSEAMRNALPEDLRPLQEVKEDEWFGSSWRDHLAFCLGVLPSERVSEGSAWQDRQSKALGKVGLLETTASYKVVDSKDVKGLRIAESQSFKVNAGPKSGGKPVEIKSSEAEFKWRWDLENGRLLSRKGSVKVEVQMGGILVTLDSHVVVELAP